jgi:5-methylcytosine-specific restriction endonuclease McrA
VTVADRRAHQVRGRAVAKRKVRLTNALCTACFYVPATERHHIDGNAHNNSDSNLETLCSPCHHRMHTGARWHADRDANRWVRVA